MRLIDRVRAELKDEPDAGPPAGFLGLGDYTVAAWLTLSEEARGLASPIARPPEAKESTTPLSGPLARPSATR